MIKRIIATSILASLLMLGLNFQISAQKVFSTKSGQINFDVSATVEIKAVNNQVDSKMVQKTGQIIFSVLIKSFKFVNALMEDHFNENYMESSKFPKANFKGFITNISEVNFEKDGVYNATAKGTLTIGGKSKEVNINGIITIEKGNPILKSNFKVKLTDFIKGSYIGSQIAEEAKVVVTCKYE